MTRFWRPGWRIPPRTRTSASCARSGITLFAALAALYTAPVTAQSTHDVSIILDRVSERLTQYYKRIQNIMCLEKQTAVEVGSDLAPRGFTRVVESELRVETDIDDGDAPKGVKVIRSVRKVNGRAPREKDKEACYDPNPLSDEPLAFLLPEKREEYVFTWGGFGKGKEQNLILLEFREVARGKPEVKEHERGRENCVSINMPGATKGRVWIDVSTHDVVRVEERLVGPVDFVIPIAIQRKNGGFRDFLVLERNDRYVRYKAVSFDDPMETMLLPESIEELTIARGAGSHRIKQEFSDYKRFLTGARVVKD